MGSPSPNHLFTYTFLASCPTAATVATPAATVAATVTVVDFFRHLFPLQLSVTPVLIFTVAVLLAVIFSVASVAAVLFFCCFGFCCGL